MANMKAYRDAQISLFQSAVSEVVETHSGNQLLSEGGPAIPVRTTTEDPMLEAVASYADAATKEARPENAAPETLGILDGAKYCVNLSIKLGEAYGKALVGGDQQEIQRYRDQLDGKFGGCDLKWAEAAKVYANYFVLQGKSIPYRSVKTIADPTIATPLGAKVRLAIVGDWGTGQLAARTVLSQIKDKNPAVVIHLGDVYYSGTQYEFDNYFSAVWSQVFGAAPGSGSTRLFNLSGNHDMYSGGQAYYKLLDTINQPASFFCLQNDDWQFLAMDTGLHDSNPVGLGQTPTFLDPDEAEWVCGKVKGQGNRKTILLSHHQLFSGYEKIGDSPVNQSLRKQLQDVLSEITMWLWGHEHDLVIFDKYQGVYGRCIGHGAFPVGIDEPKPPILPGVPVNAEVKLDKDVSSYRHGFAIMDLDGPTAQIAYYEDSSPNTPLYQEQIAANGTVTP